MTQSPDRLSVNPRHAPAPRLGEMWTYDRFGGGVGCLAMILFSVIASVLLAVLVNVLARP